MATTRTDIHSASSYLHSLFTDENLWFQICNSTWPSINDPRLDDIMSTYPAGNLEPTSHPWPSQIISAVDIRYQNNEIYSKVEFTDITDEFLSSALQIKLHNDPETNIGPRNFQSINGATLSHLTESLSLNWILIDPTMKRAGNLSSIKSVGARQGWTTNEARLLYATILPGCDRHKLVQCRIQVVLGVGAGIMGLHVKEVMLELMDLDSFRLTGRDFLVVTQGALSQENDVRRKMVDNEESRRRDREFNNISINSLSDSQIEMQNQELGSTMLRRCLSVLQRSFYSMKARIQRTIPPQIADDLVYLLILVVALLLLLHLGNMLL